MPGTDIFLLFHLSQQCTQSGDCDIEYCQVGFPLINEKQAESTKD